MEPDLDNSTDSSYQFQNSHDENSMYDLIFYILSALNALTGFIGVLLDLLLLRAQYRCHAWETYERLLAYQMTTASLLVSSQSTVKGLARVINFREYGTYRISYMRWLSVISDAGSISLDLTFAVLASRCARTLKSFYNKSGRISRNSRLAALFDIGLVWAVSTTLAGVGVTPRGDGGYLRGSGSARITAYILLMFVLGYIILKLRQATKLSRKLEDDFAMNRAHQHLNARLRLRYTDNFTKTMLLILKWHIFLSVFTWTADFVGDFLIKNEDLDSAYAQYVDVVATVALNTIQSSVCLTYPIMYCYKHEKTRKLMVPYGRANGKGNGTTQVSVIASGNHSLGQPQLNPAEGNRHFKILDDIWDRKVQYQRRNRVENANVEPAVRAQKV